MTQQYPGQPQPDPGQGQPYPSQPYPGQGQPYPSQPQPNQASHMPYPPAQVAQAPAPRKSKTPMIIAGVLALVLLVGGGFLVWSLLKGSTPAAAKGIPSNALGVIEVNLNPSAADKLAVKDLAAKFPFFEGALNTADADYKKALWDFIARGEGADFETELKPWLGDSVAFAAVQAEDGGMMAAPLSVISFQVTDKDKAQQTADKYFSDGTVFFVDDLMVYAQEGVKISADSIKKDNLTNNEEYKADMSRLGTGYLATAWFSDELMNSSALGTNVFDPSQVGLGEIDFHGAVGIKVDGGDLAAHTITWQSEEISESTGNAKDFVADMSGNTVGALSFNVPSSAVEQLWSFIETYNDQRSSYQSPVPLSSRSELEALVGSQLALTVAVDQDQQWTVAVKVRTSDVDRHQELLKELAGSSAGMPLEFSTEGDVVTTTINPSSNSSNTQLKDNESFKKLSSDISNPTALLWFDVAHIYDNFDLPSNPEIENLAPISGIGITGSRLDANYQEAWIRIGTR